LEVLQIRTGRGPCHDCYTTGEAQTIRDVAAEAVRWPQFAPLALEQGFRSVHAVPMRHRERTIGALNLFRSEPGELAEADRRAAQALADVATIGILQQRAARETTEVNEQLEFALTSRVVIEQAKGILAHYGGLTMDDAFNHLRRYARNHRLALTGIAQELVDRQRTPTEILPSGAGVIRRDSNPPLVG
jgi:GAF domain-containing protein